MPENRQLVRLSFPAKPDYLLLARLALSGVARDTPVGDEVLADLKLAVTEACGNAVRHAYPDGSGEVSVCYLVTGDTFEMIVEDQGTGMDAATVEDDLLSGPRESGMGMSIMRTIVDELDVQTGADGRGTVVRMVKRLSD
ncbi:MAG TPA: ATP-binding protein [Gaiellaceae bacterium]|nr:ATP-binding protein [Gaiellaceae bacterium]